MDFLSNKTINFVGHSILLLIQYLNLWSAVWAQQSGVMAACTLTIVYYGRVTLDDKSRQQCEPENVCKSKLFLTAAE